MLDDVIGAYLDTLSEREFDAPFMALLRAMRFYDIHFLHGQFEFGKDFVAKLDGEEGLTQYAFQSKAGDIDGAAWREVRNQLEDIRTNALAHPSFDQNLPRRMVLVTTGRLTGAAPLSAQQYKEHVEKTSRLRFEVWDRERLIELLVHSPELNLAGSVSGALTVMLGEIEAGKTSVRTVERFSRAWLGDGDASLHGAAVVALVIANRLRLAHRLDLACITILCLVRAASAHWHTNRSGSEALELADKAFAWYAGQLWNCCTDDLLTPEGMAMSGETSAFVTYPVRCIRTAELLSLFILLLARNADSREREVEDYLFRFVDAQPGAGHPISDNWAASLIPIGLVVGRGDTELLDDWLTEITRWITRFYGDQEGLAAIDASEDDEVAYLLGGPLESVSLKRRQSTLLATAVLDLAAVFERGELFDLLRNEFLAVGVIPEVVQASDEVGQYRRDGEGVAKTWNDTYADSWAPSDGWKVAAHHRQAPEAYSLDREGRSWELLATSAVLRDRWFLPSMRNIAKS